MLRNGLIDILRRKDHTSFFEVGSVPDLPDDEMHDELDSLMNLEKALAYNSRIHFNHAGSGLWPTKTARLRHG